MVGGGGTPEEAANQLGAPIGLVAEAEQFEEFPGVFPDNAIIVQIFDDVRTQWLVGPSGAYGLNHLALALPMRLRKVPEEDELEVFEGIKIMERAALEHMRESKE